MIRPLIICRPCWFEHSPGGECIRAFLSAMNGNEWDPIVYASDMTPLIEPVPDYTHLIHEKRYVRYVAAAIRRILIPDLMNFPDYVWQAWAKNTTRQVLKDISKRKVVPNYIHTVSFPSSCHWAGLKVKENTGLPWIMQLYDPWADNPYRVFKTKWLKKYDWAQERRAVEKVDLIIHNSQAIADLWKERYGDEIAKKIRVLPLTVPLPNTEVASNSHKSGELLTISHIGNFMLNRTSQPFIRAVVELTSRHPEYRNKLKVNYIGQVTEPEKELIKMNGLGELFNLTGSISAEACIEYYKQTDLFLAIDGVNKDNLFFPSKILKYLYFQRPILGITPEGSVLDTELRQSGHVSIANSDLEGIVEYLERAMSDYESLLGFSYEYWHRFEPHNVVAQYETMVKDMLNHCK